MAFSSSHVDFLLPSPRVPPEIIEEIVATIFIHSDTKFVPFRTISAFSSASSCFRTIALRKFIQHVMIHDKAYCNNIFDLISAHERSGTGLSRWIRTLWTTSDAILPRMHQLGNLTNIQELSINFHHEGLTTQHFCAGLFFSSISSQLTSLARIDIPLLSLIAGSFRSLVNLYLSCTECLQFGHCWLCLEDSTTLIEHSPIPDHFVCVEDLAMVYAKTLKPLSFLTHLHLGIFLSDEDVIYDHLEHSTDDSDLFDGTGIVFGPEECGFCDPFRKQTRGRELVASLLFAQQLKSLRTIGWSSFYGCSRRDLDWRGEERDGQPDDEISLEDAEIADQYVRAIDFQTDRRTKVWITRVNGRVRVRRLPW